jgi:hypothetical protein
LVVPSLSWPSAQAQPLVVSYVASAAKPTMPAHSQVVASPPSEVAPPLQGWQLPLPSL